MKILAVTAKPVLHSLSPLLHNFAIDELGIDAQYTRLAADTANEAIELMKEIGISGLNVTAPFKEEIVPLLDELDNDAREIGAVNTVVMDKNGRTYGYNTDIEGIIGALKGQRDRVKNSKVVVLGSGGAAKAAAVAIQRLGAEPIHFARKLGNLSSKPINLALKDASGIISTIPSDVGVLDTLEVTQDHFFLNAEYKNSAHLDEKLSAQGTQYICGTHWLVHQAVRAFSLFTESEASPEIFFRALEKATAVKLPLFFIGLMGAGKSSVGEQFATKKGLSFADIDRSIEQRVGSTVSDIFVEKGEDFFREIERITLSETIAAGTSCISCGGGIVTSESSVDLIQEGTGVWLWTRVDELAKRIGDDSHRPLLKNRCSIETLTELLSSRRDSYAKASSIIVSTNGKTQNQIVERIAYEYDLVFHR